MTSGDVHAGKVFTPYTPARAEIERAQALPAGACPRRYCWWWRSLEFEWHIEPAVGCTFLASPKPPGWPMPERPCRRADSSSSADHFEPREPHMIEDGVLPRWFLRLETNGGT